VITDDYSRFSWVFFLASKDETTPVLNTFILGLENLLSLKVKVIRCDNGTEFKNSDLKQFCGLKDALVDGKEHDDDIQKSVSPDIHSLSNGAQTRKQGDKTENKDKGKSPVITITGFRDLNAEFEECTNNSSNGVNVASSSVSTAGHNFINNMPNMKDLTHSDDADDVGVEADINNLESIISVSPILTTKIHKDHLTSQIIGDLSSTTQTRKEPKRVNQALKDPSWIEAMQEKLLQFKMQKVWILVDLRYGKMAIGTKWVYRNKKDERGIVIRNKARLVAQGHTQEKGIDYEEFFAPVAGLKLLDWFEDPENPDKVYKVVKALYGLHQVPRACAASVLFQLSVHFNAVSFKCCSLRNMVIEIVVLNILSDAFPITTNGAQLTMSNPQERVDSP
nr:hypothetical protein [Tanacetum cinerariifolium]